MRHHFLEAPAEQMPARAANLANQPKRGPRPILTIAHEGALFVFATLSWEPIATASRQRHGKSVAADLPRTWRPAGLWSSPYEVLTPKWLCGGRRLRGGGGQATWRAGCSAAGAWSKGRRGELAAFFHG